MAETAEVRAIAVLAERHLHVGAAAAGLLEEHDAHVAGARVAAAGGARGGRRRSEGGQREQGGENEPCHPWHGRAGLYTHPAICANAARRLAPRRLENDEPRGTPGRPLRMLRALLTYAHEDQSVGALAEAARREPQRAFVSASLRPYLLACAARPRARAARAGGGGRRPRGARPGRRPASLPRPAAGALLPGARRCATSRTWRRRRTWWACASPRSTRCSAETSAAVVVASAAALAEKVPDPELRPHGFEIEKGGLLDLDETAAQLVACGYERVDQVEDRGQFAIRGDILDVYPATEERAVRCELFDVEVERLTWFSTFTQRSLEEAERVEIAPAAELGPEHRELAEIAAGSEAERAPRRGRRAARWTASASCSTSCRTTRSWRWPPRRSWRPRCATCWEDVTASFHDQDAHHLYVPPERLDAALDERAALRLSSISQDQPHEFRAQSADTAARSLRDAEPELEKLRALGLPHGGGLGAGAARPSAPAYNLARVQAPLPRRPARAGGAGRAVRPRRAARGLPRPPAQARGAARAPPAAPPPGPPAGAGRAPARSPPSPTCARARRWCTRTTASRCSPASRPRPWAA